MPLYRTAEIREYSPEEREKRLTELRNELVKLKAMVAAGGAVENPSRIKEIRRTIATILTIENETKSRAETGETKER
jgi:large subunit ribosomal protein L29